MTVKIDQLDPHQRRIAKRHMKDAMMAIGGGYVILPLVLAVAPNSLIYNEAVAVNIVLILGAAHVAFLYHIFSYHDIMHQWGIRNRVREALSILLIN